MKKIALLLICCAFVANETIAQRIRFKRVPRQDVEQTAHPREPDAEAAMLYHSCRRFYVYNDLENWFMLHTQVHKRIKIYTDEGLSWADFAIPYHGEGRFTRFRAYTFNIDAGKITETALDNNSVFTEEIVDYKRRKFAMPAARAGSVIEIEYELVEPSTIAFQPFFMQLSIPVDHVSYTVEIPEYFRFNKSVKGLPIPIDITSRSRSGTITQSRVQGSRTISSQTTSHHSANVSYGINIEIYEAKDVPSMPEEPFVTSMNNYRSAISYELSFIQFGAGRTYRLSTTWDDVADNLMSHERFGQQINLRLSSLNPVVEDFMTLPHDERIAALFHWVRSNYAWNGYYGELTHHGLRKLLTEKSGNIGDINILLINLLKKADIEVYPVVLSSRDNGFLNFMYPTYAQLNYVIAAVNLDDGLLFLDATGKNLLPGYLPYRALNLDGIMINEQRKSQRIDIDNPNHGSTNLFALTELKGNGEIVGQARLTYQNYHAVRFRSSYYQSEQEGGYLNRLHNRHPDLTITDHNLENIADISSSVTEFMDFTIEGQAEKAGDLLLINPMLIWQNTINQLMAEHRELPVFFNSTGNDRYMISIKLPEDYRVESLPEPVRLLLPDNMGSFLYSITENAGALSLQYQLDLSQSIVGPEHYQALRNFYIMKLEKQAEKIVLKKV